MMPKIIRLYDIDWDTSDEDFPESIISSVEIGLPSEVTVRVNQHWNPTEEAADYLSDNYGYCVNGCTWEEVENLTP